MIDQHWHGSSIRYNRPLEGEGRQFRCWDIDLGQSIDDLRHDLSTLPLNPPSPVRSLDAFEDSLAEGLRDEEDSVRAVFRNSSALRESSYEYWQMLSRIFFSAVDDAMVGWYVEEFPPNREPLQEISISFLHDAAIDSFGMTSNCIAMVSIAREVLSARDPAEPGYSLDLTGCEDFDDCTRRFIECGLLDPATRPNTEKDLREALLAHAFRNHADSTLSVHWTGRLSAEHEGRVRQKGLEQAVARVFADMICALEDQARDGSAAPTVMVDIDAPVFNLAALELPDGRRG
ncbi:hypothetical protein [Gordonia sp. NPDC058843]|uniref:hypothetical protein n=1 Tax=Gordonia sp. NPDC058843 TaxID=3346648 RepID=UPI0036CC39E1